MSLANRNTITQYIPHRDPMVMVHDLIEESERHIITQLNIEHDNVFLADGCFAEPGMIENIAQTAAVHIGYQCAKKGIPIPIGYIAAVKDLRIHGLPPKNTTVTTSVKILNKVLDVTVAAGELSLNGNILCTCELRIFAKV